MSLDSQLISSIEVIVNRTLPGGGFAQRPGGRFRADATAWSILALSVLADQREIIENAGLQLSTVQLRDGRVPVAEGADAAYWPTPLAILAMKKLNGFENAKNSAVKLLIESSGSHFIKKEYTPLGHDTAIKGWAWIEDTHSWIEPTSMAILALRATGYGYHERVREAVNMILNRQLPSAGWNYGNTTVFNRELLPMPENTGQALCALSGYVQASEVQKSIDYAKDQLPVLRTPLSLCWCLFGLSAWSVNVPDARARVLKCLSLQEKFGAYDTTLLAQLVIAYFTNGDLLGFLYS